MGVTTSPDPTPPERLAAYQLMADHQHDFVAACKTLQYDKLIAACVGDGPLEDWYNVVHRYLIHEFDPTGGTQG